MRRKTPRRPINASSPAHRGDARLAWALIAPSFVGFAVYPALRGLCLSFAGYAVLTRPRWVGFGNHVKLAGDQFFWCSLGAGIN
ncbi:MULTISPECIES: sugar ABC transporter permease [Micromonospora]|uniref:Sugar ABC transporter permease n=1 Tax=Micromonospora sicca TaxID=2202420 RepID=A0A317DGS9_9ACTN|nr:MULTISPECIES: sugar ABC transporter permease [unclassified Micromonospora]MBM0224472.1 sugar ABC transporter permease [Micromonospora sp. ATA51]PWR13542.1 hypothetical protein DKT69_20255 [Micromonospora sp. 4G51]